MALRGNLKNTVSLIHSTTSDLTVPLETIGEINQLDVTTGLVWHDQIDMTTGQTVTLDLNDGSLTDVFGAAFSISTLTGLFLEAPTTNTVNVNIATGLTTAFNDLPEIIPGGSMNLLTEVDVSTNTKLYITNGAAAGKVNIVIVGTA